MILLIIVFFSTFSYAEHFPICAWGIKNDTSWVREVKEDWYGNFTKIAWSGESSIQSLLTQGVNCDTVYFAIQGLRKSGQMDLTAMARSQFSTYEAENHDSSTINNSPPAAGYFDSSLTSFSGYEVGDSAWGIDTSYDAGYMLAGLNQHSGHRQELTTQINPSDTLLYYEARFYLNIPNTVDQQEDKPVCQLEVWRDTTWNDDTSFVLLASSDTIYRSSFPDTSVYKTFSIWYDKDTSMPKLHSNKTDSRMMDYRILWFDNYTLHVDKVELRDTVFYRLQNEEFDDAIGDAEERWDTCGALSYYYLFDEPNRDQFEAFDYIKFRLKTTHEATNDPIACISHRDYNIYAEFMKQCYGNDAIPLLVDKYPLGPNNSNSPSLVQQRFDYLCAWMDIVRMIADTTNGISRDVWYVCQAHNTLDENGNELSCRDPTPIEIWALAGLGLAHGARGLLYFTYASRYKSGNMYIHGLVDDSLGTWIKNPKWYATQDINAVLQKTEEFLLDFDFQDAFRGDAKTLFIKSCSLNELSEFGIFEDSIGLKYFMIVNRIDSLEPGDSTYSDIDSTLVTVGLDGSLHSGWYYIRDCYSGESYAYDSTSSGKSPDELYFNFYLKNCHFKLFQIVPFTCDVEINADSSYTDYQFVKVELDTTTSLSFGEGDSVFMTIWDSEGDSSSENIAYDPAFIWKFDSPGQKIINASFMLKCGNYIHGDSGYLTPTYCDTIYLDTLPPDSNSIEVASDSLEGFVNTDTVDLALYSADIDATPIGKMRFSNYGFANLIQNPEFTSGANWTCSGGASINNGYGVIDASDGGKIYQDIDDSLFQDDSLYQLSVYVVTDSFVGDSGKIQVLYRYKNGDSTVVAFDIDIPDGDNAATGYNCITDTFTYSPSLAPGDSFVGCRVEVHQGTGSGDSVLVDNFLFEREYSASYWKSYSTVDTGWVLISGNGEKLIWAEFRDRAGNISTPVSDTVILDATDPIGEITSPQDRQVISGTVSIKGWAYDSADAVQHFRWYMVEYKPTGSGDWTPVDTFEYYDDPVNRPPTGLPPGTLASWRTLEVSDGRYYLRLTVEDSAVNADTFQITVNVSNFGKRGSGEFDAGKEPAGIGSFSNLYITDSDQGDLLKHKETGDSIGYCELEKDSLGIGEPCAIATDSTGFWIADKHNHTVIYYEYGGDPKYKMGGFGDDKGEFNEPSGIALWDKKVFVTDRYNHRIQVFKEDEYLFEFGSKGDSAGQFIEPLGITIDKCGRVFVVDKGNNRIQSFDTAGSFVETFAKDIQFKNPSGIIADTFGYIFVVDQENFRIVELDPWGDPICEFGEKGIEEGQFQEPFDAVISEDGEKLFVTDKSRTKVVEFNIYFEDSGGPMSSGDDELPTINCLKACYPVPFNKGTNISYAIANKGYVSIKVYDVTGRLIKKLVHGTQDRGWYTIQWNGYNQNAKSVAAGVYFIRMETGSFLSTKKVLLVR